MSQQINLILPELRPRFDWLALPVIGVAALIGIMILVAVAQIQAQRVSQLSQEEASLNGQLLNLQQQVQVLGQAVSNRKSDPTLGPEIENARLGVEQRRQVLDFISRSDFGKGGGFAEMLQGFSRQTLDGVWLVGFGLATSGIEIRGRLIDPGLLPAYIRKLDGDKAFSGRRFAALEMKGVDPVADEAKDASSKPAAVGGRYTEFVLRSDAPPVQDKTP
ncbi:MAG: hypothetical protein D3M94_09560 [Rhodocyclales bacterium GT-UBC]|nr:MAG: hypothetical protein D3M94_09560 [Rhodocyclales bacterium GT-UBC]